MTTPADKLRAALSLVKTGKPTSLLPTKEPPPAQTLLTAADNVIAQASLAEKRYELPSRAEQASTEMINILNRLQRDTDVLKKIRDEARDVKHLIAEAERGQIDPLSINTEVAQRTVQLQADAATLQQRIDADMARLRRLQDTKAAYEKSLEELADAEAGVVNAEQRLQQIEESMRDSIGEVRADVEELVGLVRPSTNAVDMVVGAMTYPSKTKGAIPIYPIIEVWLHTDVPSVVEFMRTFAPSNLHLSNGDRRYKIYEDGQEDAPFAELDEPVDERAHEVFSALYAHWGQWFMRVHSGTSHWDFQIKNTRCFRLTSTIERTLDVIGIDPELAIAAVVQDAHDHKKRGVLREMRAMLKRMAHLAGPLPVPRGGYHPDTCPPGKMFAWVRRNDLVSDWVTLDENNLLKQVQKIIGTAFQTVVLEDARPGVDLAHTVSRDETAPVVWFRAVRTEPRQGVRVAHVVFDKSQISSLYDDDLPTIEKYFRRPTDRATPTIAATPTNDDLGASEVDKAMHEAIVKNFLLISQTVRNAANDGEPGAVKCWPFIRNAVLFEIPPSAYVSLFNEFMQFIARLAKMDITTPPEKYTAKQWRRVRGILSTGEDAPFPEKMPFDACFFAYGGGVTDPSADLLSAELKHKNAVATAVGRLYGHLVTSTGIVAGFRYVADHVNARKGIVVTYDRDPAISHKWDRVQTLAPWIINALVEYVNEHKSIVEQGKNGLAHQMLVKKVAKILHIKPPRPPPFYVVRMKDQLIREQAQRRGASIKRHIDWQHRWQVRGHDCIRYARGFMPLDENVEADFVDRGYKVFKGEDIVDSAMFNALNRRGVAPKRNDEWMAILSYWRESFVKGPEDKPLVESTRQSSKKWDRSTDWGKIDVKPDEEP